MSRMPNDIESKYNHDNKFMWVDSQLEKFMNRVKELEGRIKELEEENKNLRIYFNLDSEDDTEWIYESPDGGETVYRRKFNDHENGRELVKEKSQMDLFPLKA